MKSKKKGQNPLLSHALIIMFSILLLIVVVHAMNAIKNDYQDFVGKIESQQVCGMIKNSIEKIYSPSDYTVQTNETMGKIFVELPERIADSRYRASFVNDSVRVEMLDFPVNETCKAGFNISLSGTTSGGRTEMRFDVMKENTNSYKITMRRV